MREQQAVIDVEATLRGLKDFQRATVDYVFRRLWLDADRTHRFLVADEVGLGKTLVAKGVIAKTIDYLQTQHVKRIDVIYVCSNADIARQNLARLAVLPGDRFSHITRLTLIPTQLREITRNPINFISFTPGTSFDLGRSGGQWSERVLLYRLLEKVWDFGKSKGPMNLFQGAVQDADWFRREIEQSRYRDRDGDGIDPSLRSAFLARLDKQEAGFRSKREPGLRQRCETLLERLPRARAALGQDLRRERDSLIADLRRLLARTCIDALEPDLVILDEFQRFKHLLSAAEGEDDPARELANVLFDYKQHEELGKTRVLLLSATPYRMYSLAGETGDDDHYRDFVDTLRFLHDDPGQSGEAEALLKRYRMSLFRAPDDGGAELRSVKASLQHQLSRVMVRTERLAGSPDRNGMLREVAAEALTFEARDAEAFCEAQDLARQLEHPEVTEYWKAAPYLLSFARDYALSRTLAEPEDGAASPAKLVTRQQALHIPHEVRTGDQPVNPPHPRLRWLLDDLSARGMWRMLWLPPSLPYYVSGVGPVAGSSLTKRLVFSSWRMVPRAIATLVSLEAERRLHGSERTVPLPDAVEASRKPLAFEVKALEPTRMNSMTLFYPSFALAALGDPMDLAVRYGNGIAVDRILEDVEARVADALRSLDQGHTTEGRVDDRWYWWAPVLLDVAADGPAGRHWLDRPQLADVWASGENSNDAANDDDDISRGWETHVTKLRQVTRGRLQPLGRPPDDLARVLAMLAVGGPAVCALRALTRGLPSQERTIRAFRDAAASVAYSMRMLFNLPEVVAMLREDVDDEAYWRRTLRYCVDSHLQSVLDEWVHVLPASLGVATASPVDQAPDVATAMRDILTLRSAQVINERFSASGRQVRSNNEPYRTRFALRFGENDRSDDLKDTVRPAHVRAAFNSPFWPFVLASTTVGQEGLDFHQYCHAVVHWNLPHNPVDLEQREGRVHRYKGHAVRKNVATEYGAAVLAKGTNDPWSDLFRAAAEARSPEVGDIVPYWVFCTEGGAQIERHVPALPLSRDRERMEALRRALVLYRMAFGQPRQDELVRYLARTLSPDQVENFSFELRIDLSPPLPTAS